jgi:putative membrane protein
MKVIIIENNKARINRVLDWLIYIFAYALILIVVSLISKSIYVDGSYYGLFGLLAAVIIYVLNKTIKPIIFLLTLPITAITLGIFYPFINILILKIVDFILGSHFDTHGIISLFFTAILISIMNVLMDVLVIKPILNRGGKL